MTRVKEKATTGKQTETRKAKAVRSARLEARVSAEHKALIEQAAELSGLTVSEFVVSQILPIARKVVDTQLVIQLSLDEKRRMLELLKDFPEEAIARREAARLKAQQPIILPEESLAEEAAKYGIRRRTDTDSPPKQI